MRHLSYADVAHDGAADAAHVHAAVLPEAAVPHPDHAVPDPLPAGHRADHPPPVRGAGVEAPGAAWYGYLEPP